MTQLSKTGFLGAETSFEFPMSEPIRVLVIGAGGQITCSLSYSVGNGSVVSEDQPVILVLLGTTPMMGVLDGILVEL